MMMLSVYVFPPHWGWWYSSGRAAYETQKCDKVIRWTRPHPRVIETETTGRERGRGDPIHVSCSQAVQGAPRMQISRVVTHIGVCFSVIWQKVTSTNSLVQPTRLG